MCQESEEWKINIHSISDNSSSLQFRIYKLYCMTAVHLIYGIGQNSAGLLSQILNQDKQAEPNEGPVHTHTHSGTRAATQSRRW